MPTSCSVKFLVWFRTSSGSFFICRALTVFMLGIEYDYTFVPSRVDPNLHCTQALSRVRRAVRVFCHSVIILFRHSRSGFRSHPSGHLQH
jgi:hypothetical protein